jgi:hypothetical protein
MAAMSPVKIPNWPGFVVSTEETTPRRKQQTLKVMNSGPFVTTSMQTPRMSKLDLQAIQSQMTDPNHRYTARSNAGDSMPAESARTTGRGELREPPLWLKHDRQVLRFFGYFTEFCHESDKEMQRTRMCCLYYYLEDDTIMISEPREENSGLPQGCMIKRHRIPKGGDEYFSPEDLSCCSTITIYSRHLRLYDCDEFTRKWYKRSFGKSMSFEEPPDRFLHRSQASFPVPEDVVEARQYREQLLTIGGTRNPKMQQYLDNDKRVLRFRCYYDDVGTYFFRYFFTLHFYLADDTVELIMAQQKNMGSLSGMFWKRAPLLKNPHYSCAPAMDKPKGIRVMPEDLIIGQTVDVQGRSVVLYDCDEFTRGYYRENQGFEQGQIYMEDAPAEEFEQLVPPHNGIGTEEDSLSSCYNLVPKVPRKDVNKLLLQAGRILRFEAVWLTHRREDKDRRFIVCTYLHDDEVAVFEIKNPNFGWPQGKFAAKSRKKNPVTNEWFKPSDFYVGAIIEISGARLQLVSADEMAVKYMEAHSEDFPVADALAVIKKLRGIDGLEDALEAEGVDVTQQRMLAFAKENGIDLCEHECMTLARAFGLTDKPESTSPIVVSKFVGWLLKDFRGHQ